MIRLLIAGLLVVGAAIGSLVMWGGGEQRHVVAEYGIAVVVPKAMDQVAQSPVIDVLYRDRETETFAGFSVAPSSDEGLLLEAHALRDQLDRRGRILRFWSGPSDSYEISIMEGTAFRSEVVIGSYVGCDSTPLTVTLVYGYHDRNTPAHLRLHPADPKFPIVHEGIGCP